MVSIDDYNELVGEIYKSCPQLFMYSPAFCRCEGMTHLYYRWTNNKPLPFFSYIVGCARFAGKIMRDIIFSMIAEPVLKKLQSGVVFVFSFFDARCEESDVLREEYFRGILNDEPNIYCFYKLISPGIFGRGATYLRKLSQLKKKFHAYSEYSFLNPLLIFKAVYLTGIHFFRFARHHFPPCDISLLQYLRAAHFKEIIDGTIYDGYLEKLFFEKVLSVQPKTILCAWENQPWHRILEATKKELSPQTVSKGFQHTGFSKKLLQHYPSEGERQLNTYPDYILCNGVINQKELLENSAIASKIIVGGALRQDGMLQKGIGPIPALMPGQPIHIAYAFSWDQSTYRQILSDLESLPEVVTVHLKFHPIYPDWVDKKDFPDRFINSRKSWSEISKMCRLVLVNDNSLMFEGYYYGMHTAIYDGVNSSGLEKRDFGSSPIVHLKREDLPHLLTKDVINLINTSTRKTIESGYLNEYFVEKSQDELKEAFLN